MELKHTILAWDNFVSNTQTTFKQLWNDHDFADVTEDGHQIKAHKVILSSNSSVFKKMLIQNTHPNPLIYLRGFKHDDLEQVVRFIYQGECEMEEQQLEDVLAVGRELGVLGLVENMEEEFQSDYFFTKDPSTADIKRSMDFCEKYANL